MRYSPEGGICAQPPVTRWSRKTLLEYLKKPDLFTEFDAKQQFVLLGRRAKCKFAKRMLHYALGGSPLFSGEATRVRVYAALLNEDFRFLDKHMHPKDFEDLAREIVGFIYALGGVDLVIRVMSFSTCPEATSAYGWLLGRLIHEMVDEVPALKSKLGPIVGLANA